MKEQKKLFQKEPLEIRASLLEAGCYAVEKQIVKRAFDEKQIQQFKDELSAISIDVMAKESVMKKAVAEYKKTINDAEAARKDRVEKLRLGFTEDEESVYLMADQDNNQMNIYDGAGISLYSRSLMPTEKQTKIKTQ